MGRTLTLAGLLATLVLTACGGDAPPVVRQDSAGIEIVRSPGVDRPLEWSFERVATLGGEAEGPESFTSVSPAAVDVDASGRLYVLDSDAFRVVVFDSALSVLRTMGGEGEGPGELAGPLGIDVDPEGEVSVFDYRKGGLVRWDAEGEPLAMERPDLPFATSTFERTDRGFLTPLTERSADPSVRRLVYVRDGDTTTVASRAVEGPGQIQLESCGIGLQGIGRVLEPEIEWAYSEGAGRLAVTSGAPYRVDVYEGGKLVRSVRRDVQPREITDEMARRQIGEGMQISVGGGAPRTCEAEEVIEKRGVAPRLQAVDALRFDPSGRLWAVRGHLQDEEPPVDAFGPDGAYLGTLPAGTPVPIAFLPDGRLVAEVTDELDVDRLVIYRIERTPGG